MQIQHERPDLVVKRAVYLAYAAAQKAEEEVWKELNSASVTKHPKDENIKVKTLVVGSVPNQIALTFYYDNDKNISFNDAPLDPKIHPWSNTYDSVEALLNAAIESLEKKAV